MRVDARGTMGVLVLLISLTACSDGPPGDGGSDALLPRVTVDTMNGVPVVTRSGPLPERTLDTLLTIGRLGTGDAMAPDEFGRVTSVAFGPDGHLYVGDALRHEVRVFDRSGTFVRAIGGEGEGPGEFSALQSIAWHGDTLFVLDTNLGRVGRFSADGSWLGQTRTVGMISGSPQSLRLFEAPPGHPYARTLVVGPSGVTVTWVGVGPDADTVEAVPFDRGASSTVVCEFGGGAIRGFPNPLAPSLVQTVTPGGHVAVSLGTRYEIWWRTPNGDSARILRADDDPDALTDEEWALATEELEVFRAERSDERCTPPGMERPSGKALITSLQYGTHGNLWVGTWRSGQRWLDSYDASLQPRFSVVQPDWFEHAAPVFAGDEALVVTTDSLDVPYVQLLRFVQ